jgi:hypothetical protein
MHITKVREFFAGIFVILLLVALAIGAAVAMGKHVPFVSDWLGR